MTYQHAFTLRPYQQDAVDASLAYLTDARLAGRNGIVVAPTGSGKSLLIARTATQLPGHCVIFQPSKEILEQNLAKFEHYGYRPAVMSASLGRVEIGKITLATIGTAVSHAYRFADVPFALVDECHLVNAKGGMYRDFLDAMQAKRILGFTATPYRLASTLMGSELRFLTRTRPRVFSDVVHVTQIGDLFAQRYLCPLEYRDASVVTHRDLKLNSTGADYTEESVRKAFAASGFVRRLVEEVQRELFFGRQSLVVFTASIDESLQLVRAVPGIAMVTADTPPAERAQTLHALKAGYLRAVANVGILGLGFDYPELEAVLLGRPTASLAVYYQQVGRVIRPHPNKPTAHVIDMVGLTRQFGKVEDLTLRCGGKNGNSWIVCSGTRQLTNILFHERDGVDPAVAQKAAARRKFWATGKGRWLRSKKRSRG